MKGCRVGGVCISSPQTKKIYILYENVLSLLCPPTGIVFFKVSLGNEAFLLWSYVMASSSLPNGLGPIAAKAACWLSSGLSLLEESSSASGTSLSSFCREDIPPNEVLFFQSGGFEVNGSAMEEEDGYGGVVGYQAAATAGAGGDGGGFRVAWKAVWMGLMVCCAVRQLLTCIQVCEDDLN